MKLVLNKTLGGITLSERFVNDPCVMPYDKGQIKFSAEVPRDEIWISSDPKLYSNARDIASKLASDNDSIQPVLSLKVENTNTHRNTRHSLIELSLEDFKVLSLHNNQIAMVRNSNDQSSQFEYATICFEPGLKPGFTRIAKQLSEKLSKPNNIFLQELEVVLIKKVRLQGVASIGDGSIALHPSTIQRLNSINMFKEIDIRHLFTGSTITVNKEAIVSDEFLEPGEIRLNYVQRRSLNIPNNYLLNEELQDKKIVELYEKHLSDKYDRVNLFKSHDPNFANEIAPSANNEGWRLLQIHPIEHKGARKASLYERFCDYVIGESSLTLSVCRPYEIDDSRYIVRLSPDNMALLGLEDTDNVLLSYRDKKCRAMVMSIDSPDLMRQTNILFDNGDLELLIGVPAPIRTNLGIADLETSITVKRDCRYLLKKNANLQLVPLAMLFLTVLQIDEGSLWLKLLICVVASPFVMYATLSRERNKISKRRKSGNNKAIEQLS